MNPTERPVLPPQAQLASAFEEKLSSKAAVDAAATAFASLAADKAREVAEARHVLGGDADAGDLRAQVLRVQGRLRDASGRLEAAVARRDDHARAKRRGRRQRRLRDASFLSRAAWVVSEHPFAMLATFEAGSERARS